MGRVLGAGGQGLHGPGGHAVDDRARDDAPRELRCLLRRGRPRRIGHGRGAGGARRLRPGCIRGPRLSPGGNGAQGAQGPGASHGQRVGPRHRHGHNEEAYRSTQGAADEHLGHRLVDGDLAEHTAPQAQKQRQRHPGHNALDYSEGEPGHPGQRRAQGHEREEHRAEGDRKAGGQLLGARHEHGAGTGAHHEGEGGRHGDEHAEQVGSVDEKPVLGTFVVGTEIQHGE